MLQVSDNHCPGICSPPRGAKQRKDVSHLICLFGSDHHCLRCDAGSAGWLGIPPCTPRTLGHQGTILCIARHLPLGASVRHFRTPRITYPIQSLPPPSEPYWHRCYILACPPPPSRPSPPRARLEPELKDCLSRKSSCTHHPSFVALVPLLLRELALGHNILFCIMV